MELRFYELKHQVEDGIERGINSGKPRCSSVEAICIICVRVRACIQTVLELSLYVTVSRDVIFSKGINFT
jgi:hypothetical protein